MYVQWDKLNPMVEVAIECYGDPAERYLNETSLDVGLRETSYTKR